MGTISTRKLDVSLESLQEALERADRNDNGLLTDSEDGSVVVSQEGQDYFVPVNAQLAEFSKALLDPQGRSIPIQGPRSLSLSVVQNDEITWIDQIDIQGLMSLQRDRPVTLAAVAAAFPQARFRHNGPTLQEIGGRQLADGTFLRDLFFLKNGSLSLTGSAPFRDFLEQNAPSAVQLLTNDLNHTNPDCHTAKAYVLSECQPDKLSTTYEQLIANAERLAVDFRDNSRPLEITAKADAALKALREAAHQKGQKGQKSLAGVEFLNDDEVEIDVSNPETVRQVIVLLHPYTEASASPDTEPAIVLFHALSSLTSHPLQYEFDKKEAGDPALLNAKIMAPRNGRPGRPAIIANVSIPLSYLQMGIFDRAVFTYTFANAASFLPRGNLDGSIYGTGIGKPFHQGDNEAIRGVVDWSGDGHLRVLEEYANEHGSTPPLHQPLVAIGYRSGSIAVMSDIPPDKDGVYASRISSRGIVSNGASTAIQLTASWQGRGLSAMEGGVTPDVLQLKKPAAALLIPGDENGNPLRSEKDSVPPEAQHLPRVVYHLVLQDAQSPHGFILGGGDGASEVQISDEGSILAVANERIHQNRLGRNHALDIGGGYAMRSRASRIEIGYHPHTEARFDDWILSPYVFLPVQRRTLDWPRLNLDLVMGGQEGAQANLDLDVVHVGGGYEVFDGGRLMIEVDGGGTAATSLWEFNPRAGVMAKAKTYAAFNVHHVGTLKVGYDLRASTNDYPHGSGRHWEHFVGLVYEQRFNQSLYR